MATQQASSRHVLGMREDERRASLLVRGFSLLLVMLWFRVCAVSLAQPRREMWKRESPGWLCGKGGQAECPNTLPRPGRTLR